MAKADADAKVEQLLQDKTDLKKLHSEVKAKLEKVKGTTFDLQAQTDAMTSKRDMLTSKLEAAVTDKEATELGTLKWEITCEAQKEYINHLDFILGPHMEKLPTEVVTEVTSLPGEVGMNVDPASRHALKVTPPTDNTTVNGTKLGKVDVADNASVIT